MAALEGPCRNPKSGGPPDSMMVLLHGRGSSGDDLIGLAANWADEFPNTIFHAPHGPEPAEGSPDGHQWFTFGGGGGSDTRTPAERFGPATQTVNSFIDGLLDEYKLDSSRCVLVGFSQGTILSLYLAPRREVPLGGVVGFAGMLVSPETLKDELVNKTPICIVNGTEDGMIPPERIQGVAKVLTELGVPNEVHVLEGLGHSIDARSIEHATRFLHQVLG